MGGKKTTHLNRMGFSKMQDIFLSACTPKNTKQAAQVEMRQVRTIRQVQQRSTAVPKSPFSNKQPFLLRNNRFHYKLHTEASLGMDK